MKTAFKRAFRIYLLITVCSIFLAICATVPAILHAAILGG